MAQVVSLILDEAARLVTLAGPGGTGKTRLALEAAGELVGEFGAGVFWIGLAPVRDPALVVDTIAQTLGAKQELAAHIGEKQLLLVLDNLEQVVESAVELASLLRACPNLRLLVTSRELLRVDGEVVYPVPALAEPEAVELFERRASAVRRDVSWDGEVEAICRRLDCLPLAIELAAVRVKVLSPAAILERLEQRLPLLVEGARDAPERQRTLRSTIEWSHELLTSEEQRLFARSAVFAGGCTLEAAEAVCGAELGTLSSLVDKSLLRHTNDRFWMLETIREYAAERLEEAEEAEELMTRHADWYCALAERAQPELQTSRGPEWFDRLEAERGNLRLALDRALALGEADRALRLTGPVWSFWRTRGYWTEGRRGLENALALATDGQLAQCVDALWGAAVLALWQGDESVAVAHSNRLLALARQHGLPRGEALALEVLAIVAANQRDLARARGLFEASLQLARDVGDPSLVAVVTSNLGEVALIEGDFEQAVVLYEESLAVGEEHGDRDRRARALANLGTATFALGDTTRARGLFGGALGAALEIGSRASVGVMLLGLAACCAAEDPVRSTRLLGSAEALTEELGAADYQFERELREETIGALRAKLGEESFSVAFAEGRLRSLEDALADAAGVAHT